MKSFNPYDNDETIFEIVTSKSTFIQNLILPSVAAVLELYGYYRLNSDSLEHISQACSIDTLVLEQLKLCYKNSTKKLQQLKQKIKELQNGYTYCPYCGINSNDCFDHYLPLSKFPQFSILSLNLIPCCGECNRIKGDKFVESPRKIINPYFDSFLQKRFLQANLIFGHTTSAVPAVIFDINSSQLTHAEAYTASSHLKILNLAERYLEKASGKISETVVSYK